MWSYILRRLGAIVLLSFGVSILVFLIVRLIPGDPVAQMLGTSAGSTADVERLRHQLGLDLPIPVQYVHWLGNVLHGDLGYSYTNTLPVSTLLTQNIPYTLELTVAALFVSLLLGVPLGVIAAYRRGSIIDTLAMVLALVTLSLPSFWLGLLLITLFSATWHLLPVFGGTSLQGLILPSVALGAGVGGVTARFVRASVVEAMRQQYVVTARSKGLPRLRLFRRHVLRNALLPVFTLFGLQVGYLLSGAVVIETVFSRPGLGRLLIDSILSKDYLTVQGLVLLITIIYALVNLLVDLMYPLIDPRIAY
ncbi:MAG: Peptide/nickel transport system permease protein [Chloroflexi bacterium]|nr:Peptide/nickel transport system permease protein [Chloroflexota bacterium]